MITIEEFKKELHALGEIERGESLIIEKYNLRVCLRNLPSYQLYYYYHDKLYGNKWIKRLRTIFRPDFEKLLRAKYHYYFEKWRNEMWDSILEQLKDNEIS